MASVSTKKRKAAATASSGTKHAQGTKRSADESVDDLKKGAQESGDSPGSGGALKGGSAHPDHQDQLDVTVMGRMRQRRQLQHQITHKLSAR